MDKSELPLGYIPHSPSSILFLQLHKKLCIRLIAAQQQTDTWMAGHFKRLPQRWALKDQRLLSLAALIVVANGRQQPQQRIPT